jgi:hypothetical protein
MSVRHPGAISAGSTPGADILERTARRYTEGAVPIRRANRALKLPRLPKPTSKQTSVTGSSPRASRCFALPSRARIRNCWGVSPNKARNTRMK